LIRFEPLVDPIKKAPTAEETSAGFRPRRVDSARTVRKGIAATTARKLLQGRLIDLRYNAANVAAAACAIGYQNDFYVNGTRK
jgi:hypothetical protein